MPINDRRELAVGETKVPHLPPLLDMEIVVRFAAAAAVTTILLLLLAAMSPDGLRGTESAILRAFRNPANPADAVGSRFFEILVRDVSALGGVGYLVVLTASVAATLFLIGRRASAGLLIATGLSGVAFSETLKALFGRLRPTVVPHLVEEVSGSFPSGHALMSTVMYFIFAAVLTRLIRNAAIRRLVWGFAIALPILIGCSRVYLGVHWPTDILIGWLLGALWVMSACLIVNRSGLLADEV